MDPLDLTQFLRDIEAFLVKHEMGHSAFGARSCNNGNLVQRLRGGGDVMSQTIRRVRAFMIEYDRIPP